MSRRRQPSDSEYKRKQALCDIVANRVDLTVVGHALVIGCRNARELDLLEARGVKRTTGVDLFSHDKRIQVMDMHDLKFDEGTFDLVYCSHALEHALNPKKVCEELVRVLKDDGIIVVEVPVNYAVNGADLHDFGSAQNLTALFPPTSKMMPLYLADVAEENNDSGTAVARLIVKINK